MAILAPCYFAIWRQNCPNGYFAASAKIALNLILTQTLTQTLTLILNIIGSIGSMLSKDRKLQLVTVYVFSCLDNCNILDYGISAKLLSRLQVVLNDCIRFVCNVRRPSWKDGVSITNLAKELHVLPVRYRTGRLYCTKSRSQYLNACMVTHQVI